MDPIFTFQSGSGVELSIPLEELRVLPNDSRRTQFALYSNTKLFDGSSTKYPTQRKVISADVQGATLRDLNTPVRFVLPNPEVDGSQISGILINTVMELLRV